MPGFIGHITAKLDAKNRFVFPSALKRQMPLAAEQSFVLKKDIYEPCLILYPRQTWDRIVEQLQQVLNPYNPQHNMFMRKFFSQTAELTLDANNRLLLPKRLTEQVGIDDTILLIGLGDKLEIWNPQQFEDSMIDDKQFMELAETLLGQITISDRQ